MTGNIAHENNCSIITGDFNIDLLQINEGVEIQKYFDLFVTRVFFSENYTTNATFKIQCVSHRPTFLQGEQSETAFGIMFHTNADFRPLSLFFVNRYSKAKTSQSEIC